jgi:hypothetical protein
MNPVHYRHSTPLYNPDADESISEEDVNESAHSVGIDKQHVYETPTPSTCKLDENKKEEKIPKSEPIPIPSVGYNLLPTKITHVWPDIYFGD